MATKRHQFIIGLLVRKMRECGCEIMCIDGKYSTILPGYIQIPPKVLRHRPDILGINEFGQICIGEAKTENDLSSSRTIKQVVDFTSIQINGQQSEVYFGVPRMAEERFRRTLSNHGLLQYPNLHVLYIPEDIINE